MRITREPHIVLCNVLALSLATVAGEMDSVEASRICDEAIGILLRARGEQPQHHDSIDAVVHVAAVTGSLLLLLPGSTSVLLVGNANSDSYAERLELRS